MFLKKLAGLALAGLMALSAVSVPVNAQVDCPHSMLAADAIYSYSDAVKDHHTVSITYKYYCIICGNYMYTCEGERYYEAHDYERDYATNELYCTKCGDRY